MSDLKQINKMVFNSKNPKSENTILILNSDGVIVQGHYYFSENDYYTHDGELIEGVQGWSEMPEIHIEL